MNSSLSACSVRSAEHFMVQQLMKIMDKWPLQILLILNSDFEFLLQNYTVLL